MRARVCYSRYHQRRRRLAKNSVDKTIILPYAGELLQPVLNVVALQYFAYWTAKRLGCEIDQPRNLAKSVTVE